MKRAIAFLGVLSGVLVMASSAKAQANPDSVFRSIMPITWNILFHNPDSSVWNGLYDIQPDSTSVTDDSNYFFGYGDYTWRIMLTLDTGDRILSLRVVEGQTGDFKVSQVPYTQVGSKIQAAVYCTDGYYVGEPGYPVYCDGGWVTIGGASPPSSVSEARHTQSPGFTSRMLSDYFTLFSFPSNVKENSIRIFDLLGRERDEIRVAPQAQSVEYRTSGLSAGVYVATLDGNGVKFIVP